MTQQFNVPSMSCQHCVNAITQSVKDVAGVTGVKVDLNTKRVAVDTNPEVAPAMILAAINEAGYEDAVVAQ